MQHHDYDIVNVGCCLYLSALCLHFAPRQNTFYLVAECFLSRDRKFTLYYYVITCLPKVKLLLVQTDEKLQATADTIARGDASFMQEDGILDNR